MASTLEFGRIKLKIIEDIVDETEKPRTVI